MKIYKIYISDNYRFIEATPVLDNFKLQIHDYSSLSSMKFDFCNINREFFGDIIVIDNSSLLAFSEKAISVFPEKKYISLPGIENYKLMELPIIDALDYKKSKIDYFKTSPNQLKRIRKYRFLKEKIKNIDIFTLPIKGESAFATELFVHKYIEANLTGIEFHEIK